MGIYYAHLMLINTICQEAITEYSLFKFSKLWISEFNFQKISQTISNSNETASRYPTCGYLMFFGSSNAAS